MDGTKVKFSTLLYALLAIFLFYLFGIGIAVYALDYQSARIVQSTIAVVPYPAAIIGLKSSVSIAALDDTVEAVKHFYESQDFSSSGLRVDFSTEDGKKRLLVKKRQVLNKLVENRIIELLARDYGIRITNDMVNQAVDREIAAYGDRESVQQNLQKLYGWNLEQFKLNIVKPDLYREELQKIALESDPKAMAARQKIESAKSELADGNSFSVVAKKYSEGESAANGGSLGWFTADQMIPQIATAAFVLEKGSQSDILESPLGFHIIQLDDKKSEAGTEKVQISQIFIRRQNFSDWLLEKEKQITVYVPLKDYRWNNETRAVDFSEQQMQEFEKNIPENSPDDASVLFQ